MPNSSAFGRIERVDRRFDALVPVGAEFEVVAEGFSWLEGPVWCGRDKTLLFSDNAWLAFWVCMIS